MKKVVSLLSVLAVFAIMTLTSCEKTEGTDAFKVTYSDDNTYIKAKVNTASITEWSFTTLPATVLKEGGYSDPLSQKEDIVAQLLSEGTKFDINVGPTEYGDFYGARKVDLKALYGSGTWYAFCWSYKSGTTKKADVVTAYKYNIK